MARPPLPAELVAGPFTVARARAAGLRACDLRGRGLSAPTHSVRVLEQPTTLHERALVWAAALPADAAFSHLTAAGLLGIPLPTALEADPLLDVMRPSDSTPTRRRGCRGHRGLEVRRVVRHHGLRVTSPEDTWCDLGELVGHGLDVDDLVVAGDAVLGRCGADPARVLREVLDGRVRPRGSVALREALSLARPGVRSPRETRARLMFVRAGFPEPEVNAVVTDAAGGWLLEGDLVWREQRVVGEYQGEHHASRRRRSADAHRSGLARDEGWTVLELWAEDLDRAPRRRTTLLRFAAALRLDHRGLRLG
jgi:hypothetical protein